MDNVLETCTWTMAITLTFSFEKMNKQSIKVSLDSNKCYENS